MIYYERQKVDVKLFKHDALEFEEKLFILIVNKDFRYISICELIYYYVNLTFNDINVLIDYNYYLFREFTYRNKCDIYILFN